ncbi:hypothetical protein AB0K15_28115 [Amycolatopsis sp. NPDC049253]|uniref:hypothetical protein n=1 Tax=Amycolatopsis sp. NPDC049253 TaxID=3155274 RepID=UPI003420A6E7
MAKLEATVTRWVDEEFPGFVELRFADADGTVVLITEKVPVLTAENWDASTPLPMPFDLDCEVLRRERDPQGHATAVVELSYGVGDDDGRVQFTVPADQVL